MPDAIDQLTFVNASGAKDLHQIARELTVGRVVLFAGAGLSFNAPRRDEGRNSMPGWRALAHELLRKMEGSIRDSQDPLKVADYFETKYGRPALIDALVNTIRDSEHTPGRVHQCITGLNFDEIITTNYDTLIERAFEKQFIEPQVIVESRDLVRKRKPPRVIKMNGCFKINPSGVVITGSDFLSYAERHPLIEILVTECFVESTVLFIGFGLDDPAFRAINERVLRTLGRGECRLSYSLQFGASETEVAYWKRRQVQIIDLASGATQLDEGDRLYRVLEALSEAQRERFAAPRRKARASLLPVEAGEQDRDSREATLTDAEQRDWSEALKVVAPRLSEGQRRHLLQSRDVLLPMLRECRRRALDGKTELECQSHVAPQLLARSLVGWLKEICRFDDIRSPGLILRSSDWHPLARLIDLLIESRFEIRGESIGENDLANNLRVLAALLSTKLLIAAPRFHGSGIDCLGKAAVAKRFLSALSTLELSGLLTGDMLVRSRYLTLLCFFGSIGQVHRLLSTWEEEGDEVEVASEPRVRRQPTPGEYRALMMSFNGSSKSQRVFYQRAAESLWSRHMFGDDLEADWRIESAFRYSYLSQAAPELVKSWAGVRLHQERLERVLGRLALEPEPKPGPGEPDASHELLGLLLELNRGWLFGCPPPGALGRAWEHAEEAYNDHRGHEVPWEALILLSLPIEGLELAKRWGPLITLAWKDGHLDMSLLIQATCLRIRGWRVPQLSRRSPLARYEIGLAWLVWRLIERTLDDAQASPLRSEATALIEPLGEWLGQSRDQQVGLYLLRALAQLRQLDTQKARPVIRQWVELKLSSAGAGRLDLALLDPPQSELLLDIHQIRILLARAQSSSGREFRRDALKWLSSWSEAEVLKPLLPALARQISEALKPAGGPYSSFDWLYFAAQVREKPPLLSEVERVLAENPSTPTLFAFIKQALLNLSAVEVLHWRKKDGFLSALAPFAPDLDVELADFLRPWLDPAEVTEPGRDEVAIFLASLLSHAPEPIRNARRERWLASLRGLIERGAAGRGTLGSQIPSLGEPAVQQLQDNLISLLERRRRFRTGEEVSHIARAIRDSQPYPLRDLEEKLIECVGSDDPDLALGALESVLDLMESDSELRERNHARLRRVCRSVQRLRAFRPTSRFAELLEIVERMREDIHRVTRPIAPSPGGRLPRGAANTRAQAPQAVGDEPTSHRHRKGRRRQPGSSTPP